MGEVPCSGANTVGLWFGPIDVFNLRIKKRPHRIILADSLLFLSNHNVPKISRFRNFETFSGGRKLSFWNVSFSSKQNNTLLIAEVSRGSQNNQHSI